MVIFKHVKHKIKSRMELEKLLNHLSETTSKVEGVVFQDILFPTGKSEFVLVMDCVSENEYLEWREICPPPSGADDWYEIFLTREEYLQG